MEESSAKIVLLKGRNEVSYAMPYLAMRRMFVTEHSDGYIVTDSVPI